jgi:hypothetical protein
MHDLPIAGARALWLASTIALGACGGAPATPATPAAPVASVAAPAPEAAPSASQAVSDVPAVPDAPADTGRPTSMPGTSIRFLGGDGSSQDKAVVIKGAKGEVDGVRCEYWYIEQLYGPRGATWDVNEQSLLEDKGRQFDALDVAHGKKRETIYFDITDYFGH